MSYDVAQGYSGAQVLEAAVKKVNGKVEDKQALLTAFYATSMDTAKGPVKLDADHDIVQNIYLYQMVKNGGTVGQKLVETYPAVARGFERQPGEPVAGTLKDKWVGMTKEKLLAGGQ